LLAPLSYIRRSSCCSRGVATVYQLRRGGVSAVHLLWREIATNYRLWRGVASVYLWQRERVFPTYSLTVVARRSIYSLSVVKRRKSYVVKSTRRGDEE
jgi:hypothetical protein